MFGYMARIPGATPPASKHTPRSVELPWPGKRRLRGNIAQAEANAAYFDVGEERLRIAQATKMAYYDYFLAHRQLTVLEESRSLLQSFRDIAKTKYEAATVEQQDVLLADVELGEIDRQRRRWSDRPALPAHALTPCYWWPPMRRCRRRVGFAGARLNASVEELRAPRCHSGRSSRPRRRIRGERYSIELACKEFYPDVEVVAAMTPSGRKIPCGR
jgi:hypothetical protein